MSRAPSAQLMPTLNGLAWAIDTQNASIVWPDSVRPLRSVIVTEIISGSRRVGVRRSSNTSSIATIAGLGVQRVDDRLEQQQVAAAVDQPAHLLLEGVAQLRRTSCCGTPGC